MRSGPRSAPRPVRSHRRIHGSGRHGQTRSGRRSARPAAAFPPTSRSRRRAARSPRPSARRRREPGESYAEPHLALRARRIGEPAHARAERRLLCRATRRSTAGLPSPPTATIKGKADLFILEDGAVKPLGDIPGHDRGSALDERRRARSSCLPPIAASTAAPPTAPSAWPGATTRTRRSTIRTARGGGCSRSMPRRRDDGGRPGRSQRLGVRPARRRRCGRARLRRSERARLVSHAPGPASTSRRARRPIAASIATGSCWRPRRRPRASASPSSKAGRATAGWSRARSASSTSRPASCRRSRPPRRPTSRRCSGATTTASGSPAGRSSARSTASCGIDGKVVWSTLRRRDHRHQQLFRADLAGAGQDGLRGGARDGRRAAGDRVQGDVRRGLEAGHAG